MVLPSSRERIVAGVAGAPAGDGPLDAVARGLDAAAAMLGEFRRDLSRQRQTVIEANPELRERELAKLADYAAAVAVALRQRGVGELQATLAAETGMTVLRVAMQRWAGHGQQRGPLRPSCAIPSQSCGRWRAAAEPGQLPEPSRRPGGIRTTVRPVVARRSSDSSAAGTSAKSISRPMTGRIVPVRARCKMRFQMSTPCAVDRKFMPNGRAGRGEST